MSAEQDKDAPDTPAGKAPARKAAAKKPAAKKAAAKPAAKAAAEKDADAGRAQAEGKSVAKAPSKKADAKKPAAKAEKAAKAASGASTSERASAPAAKTRRRGKAPAARRRRRVVRARARYVRTPARKARMVCLQLPGKSVAQARAILAFTPREAARDWSKLLESAVANAENNHELLEEDLIIREAHADEGPTIKRFRPRAMGRATPIRKRTTHLTITLTPGPERRAKKKRG